MVDHEAARRIADGWASERLAADGSHEGLAGIMARSYLCLPEDHEQALHIAGSFRNTPDGSYPPMGILARALLDRQEPHHVHLREMRGGR